MTRALIIGDSGGIGGAIAHALRGQGAQVSGLSRSRDGFDVTDPDAVQRGMAGLSGTFDLIVVATGGLQIDGARPEKALSQIAAPALQAQFALNAIGPALILSHATPLIPRDRRSVIGILSARVGSIGDNRLGGWHGYRMAKAAVNQLVRGAAVELARTRPMAICAALHPGTVATRFTCDWVAPDSATPPDKAARNLLAVMADLRPDQSGGFFDYAGAEIPW